MDPALAFEVSTLAAHRAINEAIEQGKSDTQQFYAGATIFITGGSGFLGKQLIEKLVRSCRDIKKIYLLLRPKKLKDPNERLLDILKDPLYETARKMHPNFEKKIEVLSGDVSSLKLGMDEKGWKTVTEEVDIIFHLAATINFNEPLKVATLTNVRGTREVLELGKASKNLQSFVHVSTAYSYATRNRSHGTVLDDFYESPVPPNALIEMAESAQESVLEGITVSLTKEWPNTYSFTKAVTEELIRTASRDLPICIVRPSIVICTYREPVPGWLDMSCVYGPSGVVLGIVLGVLRVIYMSSQTRLDLTPVDYVNNTIIVSAKETAIRNSRGEKETKIYAVTNSRNFVCSNDLIDLFQNCRWIVTPKCIWYCYCVLTKYLYVFNTLTIFMHIIPAFIIDGVIKLIGKKPRMMKVYKKVYTLQIALSYFLLNDWFFVDKNTKDLYDSMSNVDKKIYHFDVKDIDWHALSTEWVLGLRKYVIKDGLKDTDKGVKKQSIFKIANYIVVVLYIYIMYKLFYFLYSLIRFIF